MKEMDNDEMKAIYEMAKLVYEDKSKLAACQIYIQEKYGIPKRSFEGWFVPMFRYMIEGKTFKGGVPQCLKRFYLEKIFEDYGISGLENALKSYKGTIDYYESEKGVNKIGDKKIYEEFSNFLNDSRMNLF